MKTTFVTASLLGLIAAASPVIQGDPNDFDLRPPVSAITQPSEVSKRAFQDIGVISKVMVKDGDMVAQDQVLLQLDDDFDQAQVQQLKVEADSTARIEAAQAELDLRKSEFDKMMGAPTGFPPREREEARLKVIASEKQVKVSQEDHEIAKLKYQAAQVKLGKMQLKAPFAGQVQKLGYRVGEAVDPRAEGGAVVLVKIDPLWVEIKGLLTKDVALLKTGAEMDVRYQDDGADGAWLKGKIIFINPVADATSKTQMIRLELPNPQHRWAGLHMEVKMPGAADTKTVNAD